MKHFHSFCTTYNVLNPFPLSEQLLCTFAAFLADQGLAPQTIKSYLAAVRNMQISLGFPDPREQSSLPLLKGVQAGISRLRMLKGSPPRICLPITAHILNKLNHFSRHPLTQTKWFYGPLFLLRSSVSSTWVNFYQIHLLCST